jgi:hypothetical protein
MGKPTEKADRICRQLLETVEEIHSMDDADFGLQDRERIARAGNLLLMQGPKVVAHINFKTAN